MKWIKAYIYVLKDPVTLEIRYVGKTVNLKNRFSQTISETKRTHKGNWIKSLRSANKLPIMEPIEDVSLDNWSEREQYWISFYRNNGYNLVNSTDGGEGILGAKLNLTDIDRKSRAARSKKMVYQYTKSGDFVKSFNSLKEAVESYGNAICRCVTGKRKTSYGFIWKYKTVFNPQNRIIHPTDSVKRAERIKKTHETNKVKIAAYDKSGVVIKTFGSIREAAQYYCILETAISNNLTKRSMFCNNKKFMYV